ncbi:MAG: shikimate dehydrogenase family protein [Stomatobaculum sp.]
MVSAASKVCGLLANPIGHSLSPLLQNTLAERTGADLVYVPLQVKNPEKIEEAIRGAYELGITGMNVTVPYKQAVIPFLKEIDAWAERIGAVNTLVRTEGGYTGCNTDLPGMGKFLEKQGIHLKGRDIVLLGAGGGAKAIATLAGSLGAASVTVLNRTEDRAEKLKKGLNWVFPRLDVRIMAMHNWEYLERSNYIVFQCTSLGMYPRSEETAIADPGFYEKAEIGVDIVYTPSETVFMKKVAAEGGRAFGGLHMLVNQGILSFERWSGSKISDTVAGDAYEILQGELYRREGKLR